jgi:hypothetical protein
MWILNWIWCGSWSGFSLECGPGSSLPREPEFVSYNTAYQELNSITILKTSQLSQPMKLFNQLEAFVCILSHLLPCVFVFLQTRFCAMILGFLPYINIIQFLQFMKFMFIAHWNMSQYLLRKRTFFKLFYRALKTDSFLPFRRLENIIFTSRIYNIHVLTYV